ncbi:hypothetical protein OIU78_028803 [Salix suchowensis]|nr:hypothetical protein OIU78_028803 [Salix suchowensis]
MFFNSLSPSVKPIFFPLGICNRQDRLLLFPKPATPSQKLLSTGVSPIACAKLPGNFKTAPPQRNSKSILCSCLIV